MKKVKRYLRQWFLEPFIRVERLERKQIKKEAIDLIVKKIKTIDLTFDDKVLVLKAVEREVKAYLEEEDRKADNLKLDIKKAKERL